MTVYEKYQTMTIEEMAKALSWEERFAVGFRKLDIMKLTNRGLLNREYQGSVLQKVIENE